jgi:hypothetical protein
MSYARILHTSYQQTNGCTQWQYIHGLSCIYLTAFLDTFYVRVFGSNSAPQTPSIISALPDGIGTVCVPRVVGSGRWSTSWLIY